MGNSEFWDYIDRIVLSSRVVIDRPKGSAHPRYPDFIYPVDYGYLEGTSSSDGREIDVWVGEGGGRHCDGVVLTVDPVKKDLEIKIVLGCSECEVNKIISSMNEKMKAVYLERMSNGKSNGVIGKIEENWI